MARSYTVAAATDAKQSNPKVLSKGSLPADKPSSAKGDKQVFRAQLQRPADASLHHFTLAVAQCAGDKCGGPGTPAVFAVAAGPGGASQLVRVSPGAPEKSPMADVIRGVYVQAKAWLNTVIASAKSACNSTVRTSLC